MDQLLEDLKINVLHTDQKIDVGSIIKQRFVLEQKIGQGGMGIVYKARDIRREEANVNNPFVAIKIINEKFKQHPQAFAAWQHEAHKSQLLNHDNIIRIYDFDRDGDVAFISMEYLAGINLADLLKSFALHGLSYQQKLQIIITVAKAIAYAHEQDCVHGDLKPSNIFITNNNVVKIIDFGLANATTEISHIKHFQPEELHAYTPAYASEEILDGEKPQPTDDVYAFACIAYEFLTGYHPYQQHSAREVQQLKLTPKPIQYMPKRQWRALRTALAPQRLQRKVTMQQLVTAFSQQSLITQKLLWVGTISLLVVIVILLLIKY